MNAATNSIVPPPRASRRRRYLIATLLVGIALVGGAYYWLLSSSDRQIQAAVAEATRLDPGWQFADLEAARAVIPQKENSAPLVLTAGELLPPDWQKWMNPPPLGTGLVESLEELSPEIKLSEKQRLGLVAEMQKAAESVQEAKKVSGMPRGRYTLKLSKDGIGTPMPHVGAARLIALMLRYDATMQAEVGDLAGALETVKATIHVGRSFGDEPYATSEFTRLFCTRQSLFALERTLARGEPATAELESLQHLLEEEAEHPAQLNSARADRAVIHQFLLVAESIGIDRANYQLRASPLGYGFDNIVDMIKAKQVHAKYLHFLTACVEIAKLPAHEQANKFADLGKAPGLLPALLEGMRRGEEPERIRKIFHNSREYLLSAVVAVAMERYRRAEGRWPDDLDALVPKYLSGVPIDPFQGKPLQLVRTKGPSGEFWTIRGPEIAEENPTLPILPRLWALKYFRLWDVKDRGKPATTENNKPEMGGAGTSGNR